MIPRLATRGKLVLATALLFLAAGAFRGSPPLAALAGVILAVLLALYLMFYPTAILLRRKKIELSWWVPPGDQPGGALAVDRPFRLHLAFRNHGSRRLRVLSTRVLAASGLVIEDRPTATVSRGQQVEVTANVRPLAAGYRVLHGAALTFGEALGLFEIEAFFPNPIAVKIFPRTLALRGAAVRAVSGALHEHAGMHHVRRRGLSGELREIREHTHGDAFKFIAWKATARRQQLMVRDLESEIVTTRIALVDCGAGMRQGLLGKTPADWACDATAAFARAAVDTGDRIGLVAFDTRPVAELAPDSGHRHYLQLVDRLLDTRNLVDADLTDVTSGELVALVARYLAHQEAIDIRVKLAPPLDDPRWTQIQAGPDGQLYDAGAAARLCKRLVDAMLPADATRVKLPPVVDDDAQLRMLRLFCRMRGIELPYRATWAHGDRAAGFAAAVERVLAAGRPDVVVLISDLAGLAEDEPVLRRALARLAGTAGSVVAVVPTDTAFLPHVTTPNGRRARELVAADRRLAAEPGRRLFAAYGVRVADGVLGMPLDQILRPRRRAA